MNSDICSKGVIIIKKHYLLLLTVLLLFCSCAETGSSSEPVATSSPDTAVSSQTDSSSASDSSSDSESSSDEESSLSDAEIERLAEYLHEDFASADEFESSGFIEKYYNDVELGGDKIIPKHSDEVVDCGVTAHYSCYYIYYSYKDKAFGICVNLRYNKVDTINHRYLDFDSTEDLYNERMKDTRGGTTYELDKDNDAVRVLVESTGNEYLQKITHSGKEYDVFCMPDKSATIDEIIDFSKQIEF